MRRVMRILRISSAALLVVMAAFVAILWGRSYRFCEGISYAKAHPVGVGITRDVISSQEGIIALTHVRRDVQDSIPRLWGDLGLHVSSDPVRPGVVLADARQFGHQLWGFGYVHQIAGPPPAGTDRLDCRRVLVPHWALLVVLVTIPLAESLRALRNRRRAVQGRCTVCGYDLRATPDCCPECGTAAKPPHSRPMQRTGAAVIVSPVRTSLERGSGR